ncbi:hypothetical protein GCM10020367_35810 [Streptomyces sannanensis]|uniref:Lipoprotein CseA n=1 Tax=Streptomyces sannanensis TaxID=285536 RepID=A0ABP6SDI7_9ACTN
MRGLGGVIHGRRTRAAGTAAAGLAAFGLLLTGCDTGGTGARDEGPARTEKAAQSSPGPAATVAVQPAERVDPVKLISNDPRASRQIKRDLKPCNENEYPVDVSYGKVTGSAAEDVVVNVMTCGGVGVGTYVYRETGDTYQNVFAAEEATVYAEIDRGDLVVTKQVYAKGDDPAYPSGEDVITYRWVGTAFIEHARVHNRYSKAVNGAGGDSGAPATTKN